MMNMRTIRILIAASFLFMALFQVGAVFGESNNVSDIQKYTQYFKATYNTDVSVLSTSDKAVRQLEALDMVLEGQLHIPDRSLNLLACPQPVCKAAEVCPGCTVANASQF
jgi:hypothetical protein